MNPVTLQITGMTCEHCVRAVTRALERVPGVDRVEVTLKPGVAVVHGRADPEKLFAAVREEGYEAAVRDET
jgi:copper chaperone